MLDPTTWLEQAKKLDLGQKRRIEHDCSTKQNMIISHNREGYSAHCFKCNEGGFVKHDRLSLNTLINQWRKADADLLNTKLEIPTDCTDRLSSNALLWLARGGIGERLRVQYNILYSVGSSRVILPVYNERSDLIFYQARAVERGHSPKYLNPAVDREKVRFVTREATFNDTAIITEDILSAIRVGDRKGYTAISILGTKASTSDLTYIQQYSRVWLWFDGDQAGINCTRKTKKQLEMLGINPIVISTPKDPKEYSTNEINNILEKHTCST